MLIFLCKLRLDLQETSLQAEKNLLNSSLSRSPSNVFSVLTRRLPRSLEALWRLSGI